MHNYQIDFQSSKMGNNIKVRLFEEQIVRHSSGAVILNIVSRPAASVSQGNALEMQILC